jgi:hypothetical protein
VKLQCLSCGCHFASDFEMTQQPTCSFWGDYKMGNLPLEWKHRVWDWLYSCPTNEMEDAVSVGIVLTFFGNPVKNTEDFSEFVGGWEEMTEIERKDYMRDYYKRLKK